MSVKAKPVMGADDLQLALLHHWALDTSTFPDERQRVQLALIMLVAAFTGCRPGELVDAAKNREVAFQSQDPWNNPQDLDYVETSMEQPGRKAERTRAICYEDIRLMLLRNMEEGGRDILALEITLAHHKGMDRQLQP
jgi:Protein of unknown function (DUF3435)